MKAFSPDDLNWLQGFIHREIPVTHLMNIHVIGQSESGGLQVSAPLEGNHNDKGTGFAGSQSTLLTIAGWAQISLWLRQCGIAADVMIFDCSLSFKLPAKGDMISEVTWDEDMQWSKLEDALSRKGRGRIELNILMKVDGEIVSEQVARYAIIKKSA